MKCPRCGLENSNDKTYCSRCGKLLDNPVVVNRRNISQGSHPNSSNGDDVGESKLGDNLNLYYILGIGLIIVLLIGAAVALSLNQPVSNSADNNSTVPVNDNSGVPFYPGVNSSNVSNGVSSLNNSSSSSSSDVNSSVLDNLSGNGTDMAVNGDSVVNGLKGVYDNLSGDGSVSNVSESVPEIDVEDFANVVSDAPSNFDEISYDNETFSSDDVLAVLADKISSSSSGVPLEAVSSGSNGDVISKAEYVDLASNVSSYISEYGDVPDTVGVEGSDLNLTKDQLIKLFGYIVSNNFPEEVNINDVK